MAILPCTICGPIICAHQLWFPRHLQRRGWMLWNKKKNRTIMNFPGNEKIGNPCASTGGPIGRLLSSPSSYLEQSFLSPFFFAFDSVLDIDSSSLFIFIFSITRSLCAEIETKLRIKRWLIERRDRKVRIKSIQFWLEQFTIHLIAYK